MKNDDDESRGGRPAKAPIKYEVGRGKPPKHTRWQKGQSGNLSGRPKKKKTFVEYLDEALSREVVVRRNGRKVRLCMRKMGGEQLAVKMAEGNLAAIKFGARLDPFFAPSPEDEEDFIFTLLLDDEGPNRFD